MAERNVAIVTGASGGIGRQTSLALARKGYCLALAARREDLLAEVARSCEAAGSPSARSFVADVSRREQVELLVNSAAELFGRVDVMVNNAGHGVHARVHETTDGQMRAVFDVNFFGVFYGCRAVAPVMMAQRSGHIFNVSSVIGKRGAPFNGAYCASKFAVCGLTDSLRVEMMPYGVLVTCVCPGLTDTEFFDHVDGGSARSKSGFKAVRTLQPPSRVARAIVRAIGRKTPELVFTPGGKFLVLLAAFWPAMADRMMKLYHDDLVKNTG